MLAKQRITAAAGGVTTNLVLSHAILDEMSRPVHVSTGQSQHEMTHEQQRHQLGRRR
jgi:hypothetical protein